MLKKAFLIFIIGLILRLGYILLVPQIDIAGDSKGYSTLAHDIVMHQRYTDLYGKSDASMSPGYPFFVSAIYKIFGIGNNTAVRISQSILSSIVILFVYFICRKIFNLKIGLMASLIICLYPAFISYSGLLLPQLLATFLITLFILLVINFSRNIWMSLILGFLAGYTSLVRTELFLLCSLILLMMIFLDKTTRKQTFKFVILIFIAMSFVISIWSFRNYRVFNKFILISSHYGDTMWISTWKEEWLEWRQEDPFISILNGRSRTEAAKDLFKAGINNIKEHPFIYLKMCTKRLYRLWLTGHSNEFYFMTDSSINYFLQKNFPVFFIKLTMLFLNVAIVLLGFYGIRVAYMRFNQNKNIIHYIMMSILFYIILHFFVFATPRYAVPVMPFVIIFASCTIVQYCEGVSFRYGYKKKN